MGWFFTKAALLTFGGAYAVLPYVWQGGRHYGWLSPTQMIDGLALGETTPGPLIMVVAFVGFVGGYFDAQTRALFGPEMLFVAGAVAATLVTWFTFLPSFVFILAGGPLVEATHGELRLTAPLTAITAAVVGVIPNLALSLPGMCSCRRDVRERRPTGTGHRHRCRAGTVPLQGGCHSGDSCQRAGRAGVLRPVDPVHGGTCGKDG